MARRTLSNEVKQGILDGLRNGVSPVALATQFGVSIPTIYNYRKNSLQTATTTVVAAETATATVTAPVATRRTRKSTTASH